ncbi:MAG: hypothetical protein EA351_01650 [Gemmatimonadales bacterium]|nr:MAG: hypothetical protein EA351_01650 [Gemmatimonadales bacterium]
MSRRRPLRFGIIFVPFVQWGRYLLIVPALITWGFLLLLGADFAGGGLAAVIEFVVFVPVFGWYFIEALLDPAVTPSFQDDTWFEEMEDNLFRFLLRLALVGSFLIWAGSAVWRRIRPGEPVVRTTRQRFLRVPLLAGGVGLVVFLTSVFMPHYRSASAGVGSHFLSATVLFVVLVITGAWVTFVGVCADGLLARIDGDPPTDEGELTS